MPACSREQIRGEHQRDRREYDASEGASGAAGNERLHAPEWALDGSESAVSMF